MKFNLIPITFIGIFFLSTVLPSCKKSSNECPATRSITIQNGPVIEGVDLQLEAEFQNHDYLYKWDGPNGWHYESADSNAYRPTRESMTSADTGEYKLQLVRNNCIEYEGTIRITAVTPQPVPSCTMAINTSTAVDPYTRIYSYPYISLGASNGYYYFLAQSGGASYGSPILQFQFLSEKVPLPGIYKTSATLNEPDKVNVLIASFGTYKFVPQPDQTVYVRRVNNKLEASFCSLSFSNPITPYTPLILSGRIVEN